MLVQLMRGRPCTFTQRDAETFLDGPPFVWRTTHHRHQRPWVVTIWLRNAKATREQIRELRALLYFRLPAGIYARIMGRRVG
jgi:hypothetical protein